MAVRHGRNRQAQKKARLKTVGAGDAGQGVRLHPTIARLETRAEHFLRVLEAVPSARISSAAAPKFRLDMSWLPWPVLPKKRWPVIQFRITRITGGASKNPRR